MQDPFLSRRARVSNTWIDRALLAIAPKRYMERQAARQYAFLAEQVYRSARKSRLEWEWFPTKGSVDKGLRWDLDDIRARSRDLIRDNPIARGAIESIVNNVIGDGIRPQPRLEKLSLDDGQKERLQELITEEWKDYTLNCDAAGLLDFYSMQRLAMRQICENGEAILLRVPDENAEGDEWITKWRMIEADYLIQPNDATDDDKIRSGVEVDENDRRIAYWIAKEHPGDKGGFATKRDCKRIPFIDELSGLQNVIHGYDIHRSGQHRGIPCLSPSIPYIRNLDRYLEAELIGALISACFAVFIRSPRPSGMLEARQYDTETGTGKSLERIQPGMIEHLAPGDEISTFEPKRDNSFSTYVEFFVRAAGAGIGLPYEYVLKDFSKTNYSSSRSSSIEARKAFRPLQRMVINQICVPIWDAFISELSTRASVRSFFRSFTASNKRYYRSVWIAPGYQHIDPVKETESSIQKINSNLSTLSQECAQLGNDWEEILEQRQREVQALKDRGLYVEPKEGDGTNGNSNPSGNANRSDGARR